MITHDTSSAQQIYRDFMHAYLVERNTLKAVSFVTDDIYSVGTGSSETARNKREFTALLETEIAGDPYPFSLLYREITAKSYVPGCVELFVLLDVGKTLANSEELSLTIRQTVTLRDTERGYLISAVHVSAASELQEEEEFYPLRLGEKTISEFKEQLHVKTFQLLNDSISGGMMGGYIEPNFPLYFINDQMLDYLGYTYEEFLADTRGYVTNCMYPDDREMVDDVVSISLSKGDTYEVKYRMLKKDGSFIWVLDKGKRVVAEDGRPAIISVCIDITQSVNLERELELKAESLALKNRELEALTAKIPGGVAKIRIGRQFSLLYANDYFYALHGYTRAQFEAELVNGISECIYEEDREQVRNLIRRVLESGQPGIEFEVRVYKRDRSVLWELVRGTFTCDDDGVVMDCVVLDITGRKNAEQELKLSEERFRIALSKSSGLIFDYDIQKGTSLHSGKAAELYGIPGILTQVPEDLISSGVIHPDYVDVVRNMYRQIKEGIPEISCLMKTKLVTGEYVWSNVSVTSIFDADGTPSRAVGLIEDVTRQKEAEYAYQKEEKYRSAMLSGADIYYELNITQNRIDKIAGEHFEGYHIYETSYEKLVETIATAKVHEEDCQGCKDTFARDRILSDYASGKTEIQFEHRRVNSDGKMVWMMTTMHLIEDPLTSDVKALVYVRDIDEQKRKELSLVYKSQHDSLTGLYNRETTEKKIRQILNLAGTGPGHAFMIMDIDYFKNINDTHGHQFGDRVLVRVAEIMKRIFAERGVIGRIGGDEFVVFVKGMADRAYMDEKLSVLFAELKDTSSVEDLRMPLSCSMGISFTGDSCFDFDTLYGNSDAALYEAKNSGKNRFVYFKDTKNV